MSEICGGQSKSGALVSDAAKIPGELIAVSRFTLVEGMYIELGFEGLQDLHDHGLRECEPSCS